MKLAIIAGGKGTRLGLKDIPKPMVKIAGKPALEHQIELAKRYGIADIFLLTGYLSNVIINHFGDGSRFGVNMTYLPEEKPLGTAGAVKLLEKEMHDRFVVFYGDTMMDIDLNAFMKFDRAHKGIASIIVHPNDHPYDSDLVEIDKDNVVTAFHSKPHRENVYYKNLVNAALYILSPEVFKYIPRDEFADFGKDIFPLLVRSREAIRAYKTPEYIKDIGTADRLKKIEGDFLSGKIGRLNKANKRKAVFLDRDGVINKEAGNISAVRDFELVPGAGQAIKKINSSEYLAIVITNQPVLAKGFCTERDLEEIHKKMESILGMDRAFIDDIYYCPHHPKKGFEGEVAELKRDCDCRKPKPGLILNAAQDYNIDLAGSYFIGDRYADIQAGFSAGLKTILLNEGHMGNDKANYAVAPDRICDSLSEAVDAILAVK